MFYRTYVRWFVWGFVALTASTASINFVMDPFFVLRGADNSFSRYNVSRPYNEIMLTLALAREEEATKYIFGDSRGRAFTDELLDTHEPGSWYNFSVGGSSPLEVITLAEGVIADPDREIEELMFVLPLRLYIDRSENRVHEAQDLVGSPLRYLTNTLVFRASLSNVAYALTERRLKTQKAAGRRESVWRSFVRRAELKVLDWQVPDEMSARYNQLFSELRNRNIPFKIVLPPVHNDITDVYRDGMPEVWSHYQDFVAAQPETIDCNDNTIVTRRDNFKDPGHATHQVVATVFKELVERNFEHCRPALASRDNPTPLAG